MNTSISAWRSLRVAVGSVKKWQAMLAVVVVMAAGFALSQVQQQESGVSPDASPPAPAVEPEAIDRVRLSTEKLEQAQVHLAPAQMRELRDFRTVPGKIAYNETRYLEIKSPSTAVVKSVLVNKEQAVKQGEPLAVLVSTEIGIARDAVAQSKADLLLARNESERAEQIAENVSALLDSLKQRPDLSEIQRQFADKALGQHREQIVSAYSKLILAEKVSESSRALVEDQIVSGRVARQRQSDREVANSAFATVCEEAKFAVAQAREKCRAALQHAERMVAVRLRRLETLGDETADVENLSLTELGDLTVKAPFEGVIAERSAAPGLQIAAGQALFVLADTRSLWVVAEVPERDWKSLDGGQQLDMELRAPSLADGERSARVKFTAGQISPETRTLSIVGELENPAGKFRPGMFVWVSVPIDHPRRALVVPAGAIVQHENKPFVFVADDANTFHRVGVTIGIQTPDWVEITAGLEAGQNVVDRGTFALKSELLLEHESD